MAFLEIKNVTKKFGDFTALNDISLNVEEGEFVCLLGPSGCGKTTLLRIIAGLEAANAGAVTLRGTDITRLAPSKRNFGIVFQSYALFPNMNVRQNIAFGLKGRGLTRDEQAKKVAESLLLVNMIDHIDKYPSQLSGGQQQRVALARALALSPEFLLLDEPLSALDAKVRQKVRKEIKTLQEKLGITTIMVTHDQEEALTMSDRIVVMNNAVIRQTGTPEEIYNSPNSPFVANFVGTVNFIHTAKLSQQSEKMKELMISREYMLKAIRPEYVSAAGSGLPAVVRDIEFQGPSYRVYLDISDETDEDGFNSETISMDVPTSAFRSAPLDPGSSIKIRLSEDNMLFYRMDADRELAFDRGAV